ncbi:TfoX/Sxy family protein [Occultella kanbiaonis]|uniref:TfoX/Sxy family protein n=1 Tax=Occultella kanbiaonis TaxID=2675754 RepID=UPI001E3E1AA7|nr:TfoX/Sxy family protein [Occultella kanbiaonis]
MSDSPQSELIDRLRDLLAGEPSTREVAMFGGRSFMVNDAMVVSALKPGDLLVRVPAERHDELLARPGAEQAEMGAGRTMGPGWISVSASHLDTAAALSEWLEVALAHNRAR